MKKECVAAKLEHADFETDPCSCGTLFEDHGQSLTFKQAVWCSGFGFALQFPAEIKDRFKLIPRPV
jgi:hypothetical protein